jgi:PAS domain S-box-containing protein
MEVAVAGEDDGARPASDNAVGEFFPGSSAMAEQMRAIDWADSPFGPPEDWPASLSTACRICLTSRFPMIVWWGPELRFVYNDAYLPLLGARHPALGKPGRQVWTEIWHIIGPMLRGVLRTGEATWSEDLLLPMERHGYWEETYWTFSYSPLHNDDGTIGGVFTAVSDTTERVVGERRLAALQNLGTQGGTARSVGEACSLVTAALGREPADVPYAAIYLRRPGTDELALAASTADGPELRPLPDGPGEWPLAEALKQDGPLVVDDVTRRYGELPSGDWQTPPVEAMVVPLAGETGAAANGVMVLAASAGRSLDEAYRTFFGLVVQQTASLLNGAVAYQVQQRRAEELAELDRAKTTFFSNISHEFRTPLTLIMGPVQELRTALADVRDDSVHEELDVIHRNSLRLGKLVNTLLDFSRIEAGRMQAEYEPVDLTLFTTELASVFRASVEKAELAFEVDCEPLAEPVYVDRSMWEKVVLNLLSNALKFTFDGAIRVSLRHEDGRAVLRVADTGSGIAKAEMPRLFERFHRIPNARSRSNEGSGIGLALVRELVDLHGGTITADSEVDVGTTFTVALPLGTDHLPAENIVAEGGNAAVSATVQPFVQEARRWLPGAEDIEVDSGVDERTEGPQAPGVHRDGHTEPARVLIADDNADMREYLQRLLGPGYRVSTVADGVAALDAARLDPPDLVISDVMMPRLDGLGLVGELRSDPRTARVPVLLLSARAGQEASIDGLAAGADDYLFKPFSAEDLLARVRANLELAQLRNHHADWRTALVNSLQEGFFVSAADGAVVETNEAFEAILGYGADGLPYRAPHPWWPDKTADAAGYRQVAEVLTYSSDRPSGNFVLPFRHREGHRLWAAVTFNQVYEHGSGDRMLVGTIRDVTADRLAVQREAAQARMSTRLSSAGGLVDMIEAGIDELRDLWEARRVLAAVWNRAGRVSLTSTDPDDRWTDLPESLRERMAGLREQPPLHVTTSADPSTPDGVTGAGTMLEFPDRVLAIWVELDSSRPLDTGDRSLLALLCGYLGQALHRAYLFDQQREVALALQRAILGPSDLPAGFAVRYEPAGQPLEVGGDWYDVVELTDGRIGVVVGDCVGRGLAAASVMGQLRSACRALLLEATSPGRILTAMDGFAALVPGGMCTTVFCGILDPATGTLSYSSAGHPPAILVHGDGRTELLEQGRFTPLAVVAGANRPEATATLPLGSTLLLYTDGLVERRGQSLDGGIDRAGELVRECRAVPVEDLADRVMSHLLPDGGYEDDVAVLLYRRPGPLDLRLPSDANQLAPVRRTLRRWLGQFGLTSQLIDDVLIATGEACANAIEHGYLLAGGHEVRLCADTSGTDLLLTVVDSGTWIPPSGDVRSRRGRGLELMRALMQEVDIDAGPAGTTVRMRTRMTR